VASCEKKSRCLHNAAYVTQTAAQDGHCVLAMQHRLNAAPLRLQAVHRVQTYTQPVHSSAARIELHGGDYITQG
jgi:hypothetical protein